MIRITTPVKCDEAVTISLEGQLTEGTLAQLVAVLEKLHASPAQIVLELAGLTFADRAGAALLRRLIETGAEMESCSGFVEQLLHAESGKLSSVAENGFITRLRAHDDAAFEEMVRQFGGRMLSVARRFLSSEDNARDAVQEAFLSAFESIEQFNGGAMLSTWLHRIVVNAALMQLRRRRRKPEQSIDELLPSFDADGSWLDDGRQTVTTEQILDGRDTRAMVRRCIAKLPEPYRIVLMLRDIEELDTAETAERLGLSLNIVKVRLHRARQALRTLVAREAGDNETVAALTSRADNYRASAA
jgi:RNA polymerase sigma-70 factor (ECF subfamily)